MILRYTLYDFIKIHDDYVNDPIKGDFQKTLLLFHIRGHSPANKRFQVRSRSPHTQRMSSTV